MRRKRSATLRLPVPPGSRGIRKVSWAPRPVRDVSRLGARHGQAPARRTDHSEIKAHRRSEEHTSELQSLRHLVCRLLLEKKLNNNRSLVVLGLVRRMCWTAVRGAAR